jgi:hypothetical protein
MSPSRWEMPPVYIQSGDPETESTPTLHAAGLLGARFTILNPQRSQPGVETSPAGRSKRYQLIKTDSSMSVAPFPGATAFWTDRAGYVVTTNPASSSRNDIAGIFRRSWNAAGDFMCVQIGGPGLVKMLDASMGALTAGDSIISSATSGKAERVAVGTAPTHATYGRVSAPLTVQAGESTVLVDLDVPETT